DGQNGFRPFRLLLKKHCVELPDKLRWPKKPDKDYRIDLHLFLSYQKYFHDKKDIPMYLQTHQHHQHIQNNPLCYNPKISVERKPFSDYFLNVLIKDSTSFG